MPTYQRWCHSKGGVGEYGVCREFLELVEEGMGKKEGTPYGIALTSWSCMYPHILMCSIHMGVVHVGVGGKAVLFELKWWGIQ